MKVTHEVTRISRTVGKYSVTQHRFHDFFWVGPFSRTQAALNYGLDSSYKVLSAGRPVHSRPSKPSLTTRSRLDYRSGTMSNLIERAVRAAKLDASVYEEVEADKSALGQAMTVVVVSSLAAGISQAALGGGLGLVVGTVGALAGWYIWAFLIYLIGAKLLPEPQTDADVGQPLRTIGFSTAPGGFQGLGLLPLLGTIRFFP